MSRQEGWAINPLPSASAGLSDLEDVAVSLDDNVATISLQRPPVNALRTRTYEELRTSLEVIEAWNDCRVIVIRSEVEKIFSAGADIKELPMEPSEDEGRQQLARDVLEGVLRGPLPTVSAVSGPALGGGCALASATDVIVATERASFGLPEIRAGRCGGGRYLMRHIPQGMLRRAYFTGESISAYDAFRVGMVTELVSGTEADLDEVAYGLAENIARQSPIALRTAKESLDLAEDLPVTTGYRVEQQFSLKLAAHPDAQEAAEAFREKREPKWAG